MALFPREEPLHTVQTAMWATGPLWTGEDNRKSVAPTGVLTPNRPDSSQSYKVTCHSEYHEDLRRRGFIDERILKLGQLHAPDALSQGNILQYPLNRRMSGLQSRSARLEMRYISYSRWVSTHDSLVVRSLVTTMNADMRANQ